MMKKLTNRWLSAIMIAVLLLSGMGITPQTNAAKSTVEALVETAAAGETGSVMPGAALTPDTSWYTGDGPYHIANENQLAGLAQLVNGGNDFDGKTVYLSDDIVLDADGKYTATPETIYGTENYRTVTTWYDVKDDALIWTPIGTGTSAAANKVDTANYFAGAFDGAGHTVSGLYTDGTARVQGLFGCVKGTIKNLTVSGCVTAHSIAGGVAAYLNGGSIENCVNNAIVFIDGGTTPNGGVEDGLNRAGANGGIVGLASGQPALPFKVSDCLNHGVLIGANSWQGGRTGGIAGLVNDVNDYGSFTNCFNTGIIDAYQYAGGIVGMNYSAHAPIDRCANSAKIQAQSPGSTYVGGITAYSYSPISNCYNTGNVNIRKEGTANTKVAHAGGIVSDLVNSTVTNCYNTGALTWEGYGITDGCSSYGSICGTGYGYVGGIKLVNCYTSVTTNAEDYNYISSKSIADALTLKTTDEMKAEDFLLLLNGNGRAFVSDNAAPVNNGYPILRAQMVPADASTLVSITKSVDPAKTSYVVGQTFDPAGMKILANYSDNTSAVITDYVISNTDALTLDDSSITISGTYGGQSYSFPIAITVDEVGLESIAVTTPPTKTLYEAGEYFDPAGMVVKATYTDGNTATVTEYTLQPDTGTPLTADVDAVTVSYSDKGDAKTATTPIIVVSAPVKDENNVYSLSKVKDMMWLANQVNIKGQRDIKAKLTANVDLSGVNWTPIGISSEAAYSGSFDGNAHSITLNIGSGNYQALFGYVGGADIRDLTVKGSVSGGSILAGIAAQAENTSFSGCFNRAAISGTGNYEGGIAAIADSRTTFSGCGNDAAISGFNQAGGIVGEFGSTGAEINTGAISSSYNSGNISGTRNVGGIAGAVRNAYAITNVYNSASIKASGGGEANGVGGLVGLNTGGTLTNAYNIGDVAATASGSTIKVGAVVGRLNSGNTSNCYYLSDSAAAGIGLDSSGTATAPVSKSESELQAADFVTMLNGTGSAFQAGSGEYLYPLLQWQVSDDPGGAVWDGATITEVDESNASGGAGLGYYRISSGAQLAWLAQEVNSGVDFKDKTILLLNDIDLGGHEWTPIGQGSFTLIDLSEGDPRYGYTAELNAGGHDMFKGLFDGAGHMISGLSIDKEKGKDNGVALFGYLGEGGKIKDLKVAGSVKGDHYVGGVAAICGGDLENITNYVTVSATGNFVGGVAAEGVGSINITNCHNRAYISNSSNTRSSGRVSGVIGRVDTAASAQITLCSNTGEIYGYQYVGGIIGGSFGDVNISYCYNTAKLTGVSFGKVYLGGIAGKLHGGAINYCYNTGDLHDAHWAAGHIRAIGGIAGCEENHPVGTAITNCYTTGAITVNTSNMSYGTNWIYMFGNISGGNSSTAANTMGYDNCYYLENRIAIADTEHESYKFWSDIYKANPLIWDTEYITSQTEAQMKAPEFLSGFTGEGYFVADENNINGGYPILYWQSGQIAPEPTWYSISKEVVGSGTASVSFSADSAVAGTAITVSVSGLAPDKMIRSVTALDAAGNHIPVTTVSENAAYTFLMPPRSVSITVTVENKVTGGNRHLLTLPEGLDAIWSLSGDSTYAADGKVTAGASVFLTVNKAADACMTSFEGVQITTASGTVDYQTISYKKDSTGAGVSGVYLFTMPDADVTVSLDIDYAELSVYTQEGQYGTPTLKKVYTREDMLALAESSPLYYSGYYSETEPFIGKAEQAVTLTRLLADAGTSLSEDSVLEVGSIDGMNLYFNYDKLYGSQRYYYPNLISGKNTEEKAEGKTPVDMLLVTKGYLARAAEGSVDDYTCDTLNAYRFVFGQNETEFNNGIPAVEYKAVDKMPKYVSKLVVINPTSSSGSGDVNAPVWDGYSLDVSWFDKDAYETTDEYFISTPAQLAGLAAIVNGIYNAEIDTFAGDTGSIVANWAEADSRYCMGSYDFEGKTVYLTADIDMSGGNYMPIGGQYLMAKNNHLTNIGSSFNGTFDGQGHSVTIVCDRHCSDGDYKAGSSVGLIGRLGVHDEDPTDWRPVNPTVRKVAVYGSVYANRSVGGIVGKIGKTAANNPGGSDDKGGIIENCANFASVSNTDAKGCGGIVGAGWNGGIIKNCYNAGRISSTYNCPTGGISGSNEIILKNCYNAGNISAATDRFAMAIGTNNMNSAPYDSKVSNCWYLQGSAPGGGYFDDEARNDKALTAEEMKSDKFLDWLGGAFAKDTYNKNSGYPILAWQDTAPSSYNVTFTGGALNGLVVKNSSSQTVSNTGTDGVYSLPAGTYSYTTAAGASGSFSVTDADKTVILSADVHFALSPPDAIVILTREGQPVSNNGTNGSYTGLANGTYGYTAGKSGYATVRGSLIVAGDNQTVTINLQSGSTVTFDVTPESATITVQDSAGETMSAEANGSYLLREGLYTYMVAADGYVTVSGSFEVTGAAQTITVHLVTGVFHSITVEPAPDPIWTVTADKTSAAAGETVTVTVADSADTAWATGIIVTGDSGKQYEFTTVTAATGNAKGLNGAGVFSFVMPAESVRLSFTADYTPLNVYVQIGNGPETLVHSYTRAEMEALATANTNPLHYAMYDRMPAVFMGKAVRYVTLEQLVDSAKSYNSAVRFNNAGCTLKTSSLDGWTNNMTWTYLMGTERKYYAGIGDQYLAEENQTGEDRAVPAVLAITGWAGRQTYVDNQPYDTLNTYRFFYGQSETEYGNGVLPAMDERDARCTANNTAKWVNKVVFVVPADVPETYTAFVESGISGGSIAVNPASGEEGTPITVSVTPASGKQLAAGSLKYTADGGLTYTPITAIGGVYSFILPAANVTVTAQFEDITAVDKTPPELNPGRTGNTVGQAVEITFTDDETWRNAISEVRVNERALTGEQYAISTGKITLAAEVFTTPGDYTVTVTAGGYSDAAVTQTILKNAEEELAEAKTAAKNELANYKNPDDYSDAQKDKLTAAINAGNSAIDAAADIDAVNSALAAAKAELDKIEKGGQVNRIAGGNRYDTSAKTALQAYPDGAKTVIIARGDDQGNFADALAASYLAGVEKAPILLTSTGSLPQEIEEAVKKLGAKKIYVLGGELAVSQDVVSKLKSLGLQVERIQGNNRYATAAAIAAKGGPAETVIVVSGFAPADSLVAGPLAFGEKYPILLVDKHSVPAETEKAIADLGINNIIVIGGENAVSKGVYDELKAKERYSGQSRIETSLAVAKKYFAATKDFSIVGYLKLADAVGAAVSGNPIIYVKNDISDVEDYLKGAAAPATSFTIFGGTLAVDDKVENELKELLQ